MTTELMLALGLPVAYVLISTPVLRNHRERLPHALQRLSSRNALAWNTMVGLAIGLGAVRWALSR